VEGKLTNKTLLHRPGPKWHSVVAFIAAITIHLTAVAFASWHHETLPPIISGYDFSPIGVEIDPPESPPPLDVPLSAPPALTDFVEAEPTRPQFVRRALIVPVRPTGQARPASIASAKGFALSAPRPEYPYEARSHRITGSGVAILDIDPSSGLVRDAMMSQSIGSSILDHSALSAFKRWRFKTGTPPRIRIPITFTLTGASY
jgi:TonB family protein